jgi:hypothetical protein
MTSVDMRRGGQDTRRGVSTQRGHQEQLVAVTASEIVEHRVGVTTGGAVTGPTNLEGQDD